MTTSTSSAQAFSSYTRDETLTLVKKDGFRFCSIPIQFQEDEDIALGALSNTEEIYPYIDSSKKQDPEFLKKAVAVNVLVLTKLSPRQRTPELEEIAVNNDPRMLAEVQPYPSENKKLSLIAISKDPAMVIHLSPSLLNDQDILDKLHMTHDQALHFQKKELAKMKQSETPWKQGKKNTDRCKIQ